MIVYENYILSNLLRMMRSLPRIILVALVAFLVACGSESSNEGDTNSGDNGEVAPSSYISASNIQENQLIGQIQRVDLSDFVQVTHQDDFELSSVKLLSPQQECQLLSEGKKEFSVTSNLSGVCDYQYTVTTGSSTDTAVSRITFADTYSQSYLPPVSKAMKLSDEMINVDLSSVLPASATLNPDFVVLGSGTTQESEENPDKSFIYHAVEEGNVQVLYSASDSSARVYSGSVYITVSDGQGNNSPTAENFTYPDLLIMDESVVIDVADYINDDDEGDTLQLIGVDDFNASVSLVDHSAEDDHGFSSTEFLFQSSLPGLHYIVYTVTDHKGGYAQGIVQIQVESDFSILQDWEDVTLEQEDLDVVSSNLTGPITFLAPASQELVEYANIDYSNVYKEDGTQGPLNADIATMDYQQAIDYCDQRQARLPLTEELKHLSFFPYLLNEQGMTPFEYYNWPTSVNFWAIDKQDNNNIYTLKLDGVSEPEVSTAEVPHYVTCVVTDGSASQQLKLDISTEETEDPYVLNVKGTLKDASGNPLVHQVIEFSGVYGTGFGDTGLEPSISITTDENGEANTYFHFMTDPLDVIEAKVFGITENETVMMPKLFFSTKDEQFWEHGLLMAPKEETTLDDFDPLVSSETNTKIAVGASDILDPNFQPEFPPCESCGTEENPYTSLNQAAAQGVGSDKISYFDIGGNKFSTRVDNKGRVLVVHQVQVSNVAGEAALLEDTSAITDDDKNSILPKSIFSAFQEIQEVRIVDNDNKLDSTTKDPGIIEKLRTRKAFMTGMDENSINQSWSGLGSNYLNVEASNESEDKDMSQYVFGAVGNIERLSWIPEQGEMSYLENNHFDPVPVGKFLQVWTKGYDAAPPEYTPNIIAATAKNYLLGTGIKANFNIKREGSLDSGLVNIVLQQTSPNLPPQGADECDPALYNGECNWIADTEDIDQLLLTAGTPQHSDAWIRFTLNAKDRTATINVAGQEYTFDDPHARDEEARYRIRVNNENEVGLLAGPIDGDLTEIGFASFDNIDVNRFYWMTFSGGSRQQESTRYLSSLNITYD